MAENEQAVPEQPGPPQQKFSLQRVYVKDLSFESPRSPEIFQQQYGPKVNFNLSTKHKLIRESYYEVILELTADARHNDETLFLVEVEQAGIFNIQGIEGAQLEQVLGSMCPNILFPYARETVDSLVLKGTFPPLMLDPVNFDAIFAQSLQQKAVQQAAVT